MTHRIQTFVIRITFLAAALVVANAFPRTAVSATASHECASWRGDVVLGRLTWNIGVTKTAPGEFSVDVPSMWRAREIVHGTEQDKRITLELPYALGKLDATVVRCVLVGKIARKDGNSGSIAWKPRAVVFRTRTEMQFDVNGTHIAATLVRPATTQAVPLVVVLHGGGDSSRSDSPPYTFWGEELSALGYAVLLYDKRGNGGSSGDWRNVSFDERAADVVEMIKVLVGRHDIDAHRIGLLAVSQGGWVAIRVAQLSEKISFIVSIGAPAVSPREADTFVSWLASHTAGLSVAEADERLVLWNAYMDYVGGGTTDEEWSRLKQLVDASKRRPWFARRPFNPTERHDWFVDWYARVLNFDPMPALRSINIPMLWLYGARDSQSDVARNVSLLSQLCNREDKPYQIAAFAGADHGVLLAEKGAKGADDYFTAAPGFLVTIEDWLANRLQGL
jgi:uncharacterized protein